MVQNLNGFPFKKHCISLIWFEIERNYYHFSWPAPLKEIYPPSTSKNTLLERWLNLEINIRKNLKPRFQGWPRNLQRRNCKDSNKQTNPPPIKGIRMSPTEKNHQDPKRTPLNPMIPRKNWSLAKKKRSKLVSPSRTKKNPNLILSPIKKKNNCLVNNHQQDHLARRKPKRSRRTPNFPARSFLRNTTISADITDISWKGNIATGLPIKSWPSSSCCGERKRFQGRN